MPRKRYYTCPKCQKLVDGDRYPKSGPCPVCNPPVDLLEGDRVSHEYRGSKKANLEQFGVYVKDRDGDGGDSVAWGPYLRTAGIMLLLVGVLYYAAPIFYGMSAESVYSKALYVGDQSSWFKTLANEPEIKEARWKEGVLAVAASKPGGALDSAIESYKSGQAKSRAFALFTGILGAIVIGGAYYASENGRMNSRRLNIIGFVVLAGLLVSNGYTLRKNSSAAVAAYGAYAPQVDLMLGVLTHAAIKSRNAPLAMSHLNALPPIHMRDGNGATYLHWAADRGLETPAAMLLSLNVNPNEKDATGMSPLHYAIRRGQELLAALLLKNGADVNAADNTGTRPLHLAAARAQPDMLDFLIHRGADPNVKDQDGQTPLYAALQQGYTANVMALVEGGADVNTANADGVTLLQSTMKLMLSRVSNDFDLLALADFPEYNMLKLLVEKGANVNAPDAQGQSALHLATTMRANAADGSPAATILDDLIDLLFEHGADPNVRDTNGEVAYTLMDAARFGHARWAKQLLQTDPTLINTQNAGGKSPLQFAVEQNNVDMVTVLLEAGADIYAWSDSRSSALHNAAAAGSTEIVKLLLAHGFSLAGRYNDVDTPITLAAARGHNDIVAALLDHNEIGDVQNTRLDNPLLEAAEAGNTEIVRLLLDHGFDVGTSGADGETALHRAARQGHAEIVDTLLERGADTATWNNAGKTAFDIAREANHNAIATRLKRVAAER